MRNKLTVKAVQKAKENSRVILTEFLNQVSDLVLWIQEHDRPHQTAFLIQVYTPLCHHRTAGF
jgi:hypothetical protein